MHLKKKMKTIFCLKKQQLVFHYSAIVTVKANFFLKKNCESCKKIELKEDWYLVIWVDGNVGKFR